MARKSSAPALPAPAAPSPKTKRRAAAGAGLHPPSADGPTPATASNPKAGVAQLAEQVPSKHHAPGSIPGTRSKSASKAKSATNQPPDPWATFRDGADSIDDLCSFIVAGGHMGDFCRERGFKYTTVRYWIEADADRAAMYARAREDRSDKLAEEIVSISDEQEVQARYEGKDVRLSLDAAAIQRNRLRVDARKWIASKLKPRVYGDKLDVTQQLTVRDMPDDELMRRAAALMAALAGKAQPT